MRHTHNMKPTSDPKVLKCDSCMFLCTKSALSKVRANSDKHLLVKKNDPQAKEPWNG